MADRSLVRLGLLGLGRAMAIDGWFPAHYPAAVLAAAALLGREDYATAEPAVREQLARLMERFHRHFAAASEAPPLPDARERIAACLARRVHLHSHSGHQAIFGAHALRFLAEAPEAGTAEVVDGVCALLDYFTGRDGVASTAPPEPFAEARVAELAFAELAAIPEVSPISIGHVALGHVLTHAHALVELSRLGYGELAQRGFSGWRVHVAEARAGFANTNPLGKRGKALHPPTSARFWREEVEGERRQWEFGHVFKYLDAFHRLEPLVADRRLREAAARGLAYLI